MVWKPGMQNWQPAGAMAELQELFGEGTPPPPPGGEAGGTPAQ